MLKLTDHPSREELSAYSLGQLPEERAVAIDSHISECEPCCETIVKLSSEDTFAGLLQEAGRLPTDQTANHDSAIANSASFDDIPQPLCDHPRYEILGLIGKGGMGDVYEARHRKMERTVALKVINRGLVQKAEAIDRFHREVKAAAQLSHPNIVTSHDADHAGDFHFMVMEFVDGVDLSQTVKKRGALPVAEACDYIQQVALGLQHAHQRGMVHRDIKPHNMMVTQDGTVKILDFGLASLAPQATPSEPISEDADGNLTIAGAIMGTPDFISPEQARDARQVDGRSDIYSLGMTLYYLLAGHAPFREGSAIEKLKKQAEAEPEPLSRFREDVPAELANILHRMTAKNPAERFQSPQEVADALQPFASELTTVSKPQPAPQKTRAAGGSIVRWIGAAILFAMLGAGGMWLLNLSDPEADYKSLDKFLATGDSDEPAGDIVRRLLRTEVGRQFLRKLDARHPTLAYTEGQFARGYTSVAAFAYENRITGVAQPELLVIGWGPTVSGMKTCNVVESFTLEAIEFDNAPDNTCLATLQFRTPHDENRAFGLKAQSLYEAEIPIQTLIEGSLSLSNEFKKGKFVRNAPKDSSEPTDPQVVSDSNSNHQTDMPGGPGEQGFDSVLMGAIMQAAGLPRDQWESIARSPIGSTAGVKGEPLSLVLLNLQPELVSKTNPVVLKDFQWTNGIPKPTDLQREMSRHILLGKVSMLKRDGMSGLTYKTVKEGENPAKLIGSVRFSARDLYSGKVEFVAELEKSNQPKVVEFTLPNYGLSIERLADGNWKSRDLPAGVNAYKRPFDYDLSLVPADAMAVYGFRPHQIRKDGRFRRLLESLDEFRSNRFLGDENLKQVLTMQWANADHTYSQPLFVMTVIDGTATAFAREKLGVNVDDKQWDAARWTYYPVGLDDRNLMPKEQFVRFVDDKTLVLSSKDLLDAHQVALKIRSNDELRKITSTMPDGVLWVVGNTTDKYFVDKIKFHFSVSPLATTLMTQIPIWEDTSHLAISFTLDDFPILQLSAHGLSADRQPAITQTARALPVTLANLLRAFGDGRGPVDAGTIGKLVTALNEAKITEPSNTETRIIISLKDAEKDLFSMLNSNFNLEEAKFGAFKAASLSNLKQIGMAFMLFEQEHGYLPSVTTELPGGKHPVSWRVAILKYLDQELYNQYKLDEPWDSDDNKKLLEKLPSIYRHPNQEEGITNTCYVTLAGENTATGNGDTKIKITDDITDDPRQTILVTEGFTRIPWTKPEDHLVGDEAPLPARRPQRQGWHAVFVDGSTHFISSETSEDTLQSLISRNDGKRISNERGSWKQIDGQDNTLLIDQEGELKQLQGNWETVAVTEGGKQLAAEDGFGGLLLQIKGDTFVIAERMPNGEKSEVDTGRIKINSTTTQKTIDLIGRVERRVGIYELNDGVLRVCVGEQGGSDVPAAEHVPDSKTLKRPTAFESPVGSNMMRMVFQQKESTTKAQPTEHVGEVQAARPFSYDLSLVPANAQQVIGARPGNILRDPQLATLRENTPPLAGFTSLFVNENVAEVLAITLPKPSRMSNPRVIVLTVEQGDAMEEVDRAIGIQKLGRGDAESEYKSTGYVSREGRLLVRRIDRQTVVLGTRKELDGHKLAMNVPMPNELREVSKGMQDCEAFLIASSQFVLNFGPEEANARPGVINEILNQLRFLHGETKFLTASVSLGEKPRLQFSVRAKVQERNHEVAMAVSEIRDQAMTLIRGNLNQLSDGLFFKDQESAAAATASLLLSRVTEPTPKDTLLDVPLMPAMSTVVKMLGEQFDVKKLQRNVARFNMQGISLGFFQFESQHGYLPSASTKIPGAAHPVSWRVAILPYVGQEKLYAQYKLDEPWDSEHNESLLAKMPELYRHPSSWRQSTETNVVSFVGADTAVGTGDGPVRLEDFPDDLGLTILVAESATGIPWTKPEDVPFTAGEPLPPIGELGVDGWNAVFADGSVQFVPQNTSTDVIAAMLTRNGGESVQVEDGKFSLRKVGEQSREWHPEEKESNGNRATAANDSHTDDTPDSLLNNAADVESLPLVVVPNAAPGEGMSILHNQPGEVSENHTDPVSVIRQAVLPHDFDAAGAGWQRFRVATKGARGGTASGVLENFRPLLDNFLEPKLSLQELTDDVEVEVKRHPHWKAGVALLGYLEAELGNEERAVKLFEQVLAEREYPITPEAAWIFGLAIEGKGAKLDEIVIALYEINVERERDPESSIRESAIASLARLYANYGRRDQAKRLLHRLTEPEGPYVVCPWARGAFYKNRCTECHQQERGLENYILMANALTDIGSPVEARMSLARISVSFKNAYDSDEAWAKANTIVPDWEYQGKEAFQPAKAVAESRITPQLFLKALEAGVFNEPNPLKSASREPASSIDLILGVRGEDGKSIVFSPVIDMLALAARAKGDEAVIANNQIDRMLADAFERNFSRNDPDQLEVGIAATVFAFLRNDLDAAASRIETLNKPLPDEEARKTAVGLWLVAREAFKHERTRKYGENLTKRALAAAEQLGDPLWEKAIREEHLKHDQERKTDASINETPAGSRE